jgi:hypothetical protein
VQSPTESRIPQEALLSPEIARVPPPRTPASIRSRPRDTSSEYYTAAWGSPYDFSPSSRSARTAPSEQAFSEEQLSTSPDSEFGLGHLIPNRLANIGASTLDSIATTEIDQSEFDPDVTPRSRAKRWIQLPRREDQPNKVQWWSEDSRSNSPERGSSRPRPGVSSELDPQASTFGHPSRDNNRTLDQQTFWERLREHRNEDMSSLYASRWAATPPADEDPLAWATEPKITTGLSASRWADTPPAPDAEENSTQSVGLSASRWADTPPPPEPEEKMTATGLSASRWADTPSPVEANGGERKDEGGERFVEAESANEDVAAEEGSIGADGSAETKECTESAELDNSSLTTESQDGPPAAETATSNAQERDGLAVADQTEAIATPVNDVVAEPATPIKSQTPASPVKQQVVAVRPRKRVAWGTKFCTIQIPDLDYPRMGVQPLSVPEAQSRYKGFEDAGHEIDHLDMAPETETSNAPAHVRPIYPDESELYATSRQERAKVVLPDLSRWKAYTDYLVEQKLAALGVSLGGDEPASAGAQDMSRQSSAQYPPLPFSPPIPASSASSMGRPGLVRGHSHTMSVTSPISPMNGPMGHMHRHSTFTGFSGLPQQGQPNLQSLRTFSPTSHQLSQHPQIPGLPSFSPQPQQSPHQQILPGMQAFSPQGQFAVPNFNRTGSPGHLAALRNEVGAVRGPGSPLSQPPFAHSPQEYGRPQLPPMPNAFMQQGMNIQPAPLLPELPEEEDEDELLEKDEPIPAPEQKAEPEIEPETPTYVPPHKRAQLNANIAVPTPRGHRHNISEGLERDILEAEKRHQAERDNWIVVEEDGSSRDVTSDTNSRALSGSRASQAEILAEKDPLSQGISVQESVHNHKRSGSRLPAAPQPFKFNPGASFQPGSTAFTFGAPAPAAKSNGIPALGHNRNNSSSTFNVAAPEFKPSSGPAFPKSDFSFSASGPTFKPDAPVFEPKKLAQSGNEQPNSIFGKVEIPDIVKPARRSKALPIVRPVETPAKSASGTDVEDEEGRIAQSTDRQKRQRKIGDDGDEVPRFAEPTPIPAPADFILKSQAAAVDEEREIPVLDDDKTGPTDENQAVSYRIADVVNVFTPPDSSEYIEPEVPKFASHGHKHSSSLSALAKPFQPFGFSQAEDQKPGHESRASFASISELEEGEIRDDEHPPTSPLEQPLASSDQDERAISPLPEPQLPFEQPASARVATVADAEPSFDEIDAVMRQLNEVSEPQEAQEVPNISPLSSPGANIMDGVTYLPKWSRSDAPSPSPRRGQLPYNPQVDSSFTMHTRTDSGETPMNGWPHANRLNKNEDAPPSDWSGFFSDQDEEKLQHRGHLFDSHVEKLIGNVVERRLQPLEDSLRTIQESVVKRPTSRDLVPKRSSSAVDSDADDEDESDQQRHRPISRGRDKRADQIKYAVLEALREQGAQQPSQSAQDLQELHSVLADIKMSFARAASAGLELDDVRAVVEETVNKQSQALVPSPANDGERSITHKREISELEGRLNETLAGALEEANRRRAVEEREVETKRMLRLAEEELQLLRDSSRDDDSRLQAAEQEREDLLRRLEKSEDAQRDMEAQVKNLEDEHEAAQATLEEYRVSSNRWRQDIDQATRDREDLETTIATLERELEESQDMGSSMRRRLEKLHSDMATAAGQVASEKATRQAKEDEYRTRCDLMEAQQSIQLRERTELEAELHALRSGNAETAEARVTLEQMRVSNASLEEAVRKLQLDLVEQQSLAARYERDFNDAREAGRSEVERTRMSMETDIESANHQVNVVRVELESELSKVRAELENAKMEAETTKARHERHLEEEDSTRRDHLRKVNHASSVALDEARQNHETAINELTRAHERALNHAVEDKQRSEYFLNERLSLSDAKLQHFQDRVLHLEERLEVAKSAAQAAAISAQSKGVAVRSTANALPEKISPQALRESILVLQEQLQERESTIDKLQNQVDKEGPAEMKKRDDEIAWLRELLGVRSEELTELVNTLAQPTFARATVRDTAIRIRASLQMEQQEKERFAQDGQNLPSQALASLSNFATPKAAQLGAAFSKWRSTMESSALKNAPRGHGRPRAATPSKAPATAPKMPPGFAAGLMTPPASNLRSSPSPEATRSLPPPQLQSHAEDKFEHPSFTESLRPSHSRQPSAASDAPPTPLFRSQSYDKDAEDSSVHMQAYDDEDLEVADNQPPVFRSLEAELDGAGEDD